MRRTTESAPRIVATSGGDLWRLSLADPSSVPFERNGKNVHRFVSVTASNRPMSRPNLRGERRVGFDAAPARATIANSRAGRTARFLIYQIVSLMCHRVVLAPHSSPGKHLKSGFALFKVLHRGNRFHIESEPVPTPTPDAVIEPVLDFDFNPRVNSITGRWDGENNKVLQY
ncbi:hypothetical protein EVAR_37473_1 [Eumeta japonica]|uniref:Uncharacterized protein n=1 Tax=Eumeta variegata TaxID=151549 RepID=A0A4C1XFY7_EUMVA|nr:hypothetical protein EVAR_37473_1 [Eumeta japonica]